MTSKQQAPAPNDAATRQSKADNPKRQGDKLGVTGVKTETTASTAIPGDSPKPHGDGLRHAVDEAAKG